MDIWMCGRGRQPNSIMKKSPLKRNVKIRPVSSRQAEVNAVWNKITDQEAERLDYTCSWCGKKGHRAYSQSLSYLDGHHKERRNRTNHTAENCYVVHRLCHSFLEIYRVDVTEIPSLQACDKVLMDKWNKFTGG